jgi:predicted nucleic acid-binding protein
VTIRNSRIALDTNVWIYGLRQDQNFFACSELLENLRAFQAVIPRQVLAELQANLTAEESRHFWQLIHAPTSRVEISWDAAPAEPLDRYRRLGCRRGDAAVAAQSEFLGAEVLVTENRELLRGAPNLPFRLLTSSALLAELRQA